MLTVILGTSSKDLMNISSSAPPAPLPEDTKVDLEPINVCFKVKLIY